MLAYICVLPVMFVQLRHLSNGGTDQLMCFCSGKALLAIFQHADANTKVGVQLCMTSS